MSTIKVRIEVTADGGITDQGAPAAMAWERKFGVTDNPRFFGKEVLTAIDTLADAAKSNVEERHP